MIYADTSALVKLVVPEAESSAMHRIATLSRGMFTSVIGATELLRAIRRTHPGRLEVAERILAPMIKLGVTKDVLRLANVVGPASLRTLDAIHLASALTVREELDAFVAYDLRLIEAARAVGLPIVSPR